MRQIVTFVKKKLGGIDLRLECCLRIVEMFFLHFFRVPKWHFDCSLIIFGPFIKGNIFLESASFLMAMPPKKINKLAISYPKLTSFE